MTAALILTVTTAGLTRFAAAQASDDIDLTIASVGLTATRFVVAPTLTALPGETRRITNLSGSQVGDNIIHMIVRDDEPLSYQITGFGLFLADGTLFAVYGQDDPIAEKSVGSTLLLAFDVAFPTGDISELRFGDTNFLNPPATTSFKGVVELATVAEGLAGADLARVPPVAVVDAMIEHSIFAAVPIGIILLWLGFEPTVPPGWAICDGRTVERTDGGGPITTPDLRNRVAVGASAEHEVGSTFGASEQQTSQAGAHTHLVEVEGDTDAAVTGITLAVTRKTETAGGGSDTTIKTVDPVDAAHTHHAALAGTAESAGAHGHTVDVTQPSIAIHYIMKV
ncbi:phage tail protein [Sphingomonas melonis]|uniref:phage tail protein n=1 Tax=Sphingomonas melonis TaxID=152682 RepID=UPI000BE2CC78|nr:phage tail protein [Sphingomonas melonis]ATI54502.1 hypothetical protein CP552_01905 [Sphingomonas melonis]